MINLHLLQHTVVLSQPAILIFRLTTSQKESITDDQSSFEIVFASKIMSWMGLKYEERYLCCNLLVHSAWLSLCMLTHGSSLCCWPWPLYSLCQGKIETWGEPVLQTLGGWEEGSPGLLSMVWELLWLSTIPIQPFACAKAGHMVCFYSWA